MKKEFILKRPIKELVWKLSPPGIAGMLMISVNAIVDAIFAGQFLGSAAVAGISLSLPFISLNLAIVRLVGMGSASVVSRSIGADRKEILGIILYYSMGLLVAFSLIITFIGYFFSEVLIKLMGGSEDVLHYGSNYLLLMSLLNLPSVFGVGTAVLIRAEGKISYSMKITATGVVLNLILCPLFCGVLNWGITGIAFSTIIAMSIYSVMVIRYFFRKESVLFFGNFPRIFNYSLIKEILSIGLPGLLNQVGGLVRQFFLFKIMAIHGAETGLIIFSAIYRTFSFSVTPTFGVVQSLQPVTGINYGAKQFERVRKSYLVFLRYSMFIMAIIAVSLMISPSTILFLLIPDITLNQGDIFHFRLLISILLIFPIFPSSITFLQAIGKGKQATCMTIGRDIVLFYPMIFLTWFLGSYESLYYGIFLENLICSLIFIMFMHWQLKKIGKQEISCNKLTVRQ